MELDERQQKIMAAIDAQADKITAISHRIHENPEVAFHEFNAMSLLTGTLHDIGFDVDKGIAHIQTAFRAHAGSGTPRLALIAEYDALIEIGHACGHNIIAAASTAAAIGLKEVIDELQGEIVVIGTPAEEGPGAKIPMLQRGAFNGLDAVMMIHPYIGNFIGTESMVVEEIRIRFFGHTARTVNTPWEGHNALDALLLAFNGINAMRQNLSPDARVHGVITEGGLTPSIIPTHTEAHFYCHAKDRIYLEQLTGEFKELAEKAAHATGTRLEFDNYPYQFNDMVNNYTLGGRVKDYMIELGSGPFARSVDFFGPVDLGNVSHFIPSAHVLVDIAGGTLFSPHTEEFCHASAEPLADEVLLRAGKALALTAYDFFNDPLFFDRVRSDYVKQVGRQPGIFQDH